MNKIESTVSLRRAVFLDRDGVLNAELEDFVKRPEDLKVLPGVPSSIHLLVTAGWMVIVFTNQSGIGRGLMSLSDLNDIHLRLRSEILIGGSALTDIFFCPHHPDDGCDCRKPGTGLLLLAAEKYQINLSECIVIGDSPRDIASGERVGCETILVLTGKTVFYDPAIFPYPQPNHIFKDLTTAANWILVNR